MGYYIETPMNLGKAEHLVQNEGAEFVMCPDKLADLPEGKVLVCVVNNGAFEAAGIAFSQAEMEAFAVPDGRPRKWLTMDRDRAKELSPHAPI